MSVIYIDLLIKWVVATSKNSLKAKNPFKYSKDACDELIRTYESNQEVKMLAKNFYIDREKFNKKIDLNIKKFTKTVEVMISGLDFNMELKPMSSYPKLNLPNDSDFDLGLLVKKFDTEKMFYLTKLLCENGYSFEKVTKNKGNPGGDAYRYSIMFNGIECEVKVRNYDFCSALRKLHDRLNSLSESESIFWTYHKYLVKEWAKKNDTYIYELFKMILFHRYFYGVKGAFVLIPG